MSMEFRANIDLDRISDQILEAAERGLEKAAEHMLDVAKGQVPVDTGELRDSGRTRREGDRTMAVEFMDPVAIIVHENQTARHDDGSAKYLEKAFGSEAGEAGQIIAREIRGETGG